MPAWNHIMKMAVATVIVIYLTKNFAPVQKILGSGGLGSQSTGG